MPRRNPKYFEAIPWRSRLKKNIQRRWHRFKFAAMQVPLFREGAPGTIIPTLIWRTPRLTKKGRRLALKPPHRYPEMELEVRKALVEAHERLEKISQPPAPRYYTLSLSKRYPTIYDRRIEDYYDVPTLRLFLDKKINRRTRAFLTANKLTMDQAHELALNADLELDKNVELLLTEYGRKNMPHIDMHAAQVMVTGIDKYGRMNLVIIDN